MQSPNNHAPLIRRRSHRAALLALPMLLALGAGSGSCANEEPARSFVQPNILAKSDLQGTFYYIQTVTDSPPTNGAMFIGQSSILMQIRFDVEENTLFARRAYPQIANSESDATLEGPNYMGEPLAAWNIEEQFDIIRQYNSTTGEQTNEIVESTERPWEQRAYIRVDWSKNLITDYVGLGMDLFFSDGQPTVEPVSFWQSDPTQPDALHIEHLANNFGGLQAGDMSYFDITDEMIITPENLTVEGQTFPKCFFFYELDDCASQLIKVRHAFAKMDPQHTYEPRAWDGIQMNLFGVWDVGLRHLSYNTEYGITNTGASQTAARFNLWQKSYDSQGNYILPANRTLLKIPYYAEGSRPITYQGDPQFPDGMQDSIYPPELWSDFTNIIGQWNDALQVAVRDLQGLPSNATVPTILVPCHNPVRTGDDPVCWQGTSSIPPVQPTQDANGNNILDKQGNPIYEVRPGDPRHSCVFWVDQMQAAGPLGYGPPLYNELTGETVSGQAYIYGAALQTYAARSRDLLLLTNGDISQQDYVTGANVASWVSKTYSGTGIQPGPQSLTATPTFTQSQVNAMAASMDFSWARGFTPQNGYPAVDTTTTTAMQASLASRLNSVWNNYYVHGAPDRDNHLQSYVGTSFEQQLATPEQMAISGVSPMYQWEQLNAAQQVQVSPLQYDMLEAQLAQTRTGAEIRGVDFYDQFTDNGMSGRQCYYLQQYYNNVDCETAETANANALAQGKTMPYALEPYAEDIRLDLIHTIFTAVTLHEVGHNMGCRHNFRASYDAMNYQPTPSTDANGTTVQGYWDIRTRALGAPASPGMNPSDGHLHPRYVNQPGGALTRYEIDSREQEYQYSSIMDYGSEFYSDLHGLGLYDKAVIKFSYANTVEVFTGAKPSAFSTFAAMSSEQNSYGLPSVLGTGVSLSAVPYQTFPSLFTSGWQGIYQRSDVPYSQVSYVTLNGNTILEDGNEEPVVPYYFCSDEYVGNLTCQRFDSGADPYEQATDIISRYQNFYLYNDFKRDKATFFTSEAYKERIASRYFDMLRDQLTWYTLYRSLFEQELTIDAGLGSGNPDTVGQQLASFFTSEDGWGPFTVAVSAGFDLLGNVLVTPEAGLFYNAQPTLNSADPPLWTQFNDEIPSPTIASGGIQTVGLIDGKYSTVTWDFADCGYYWYDYCQTRIGYLVDKEIALDELSQSTAYFTGFDTAADVRQYAIGYIIPFKAQLQEKLGALFANDYESSAPYFAQTGTDTTGNPIYSVIKPSWSLDSPNLAKSTSDPLTGMINPSASFTLQLYAGIYSMAGFPTTFDPDFINNTQVFIVGNGEAPVPDATLLDPTNTDVTSDPSQDVANGGNAEWLLVTDPESGETFGAHSVPLQTIAVPDPTSNTGATTASNLRTDIAARMLERLYAYLQAYQNAQTYAAANPNDPQNATNLSTTQTTYENYRDNVQVMRTLQKLYGSVPDIGTQPVYY